MDTNRTVNIECLNCTRRFSFIVDTSRQRRVQFLDQDGQSLGWKLILPKSYAVPCPYCHIDNMVHVP